jgi:hypothetical protein
MKTMSKNNTTYIPVHPDDDAAVNMELTDQ